MTRAPALPQADRLLTKKELGQRIHRTGRHLRAAIEASRVLKAGRRYVGQRAVFIESYVVQYMHHDLPAEPVKVAGRRSA